MGARFDEMSAQERAEAKARRMVAFQNRVADRQGRRCCVCLVTVGHVVTMGDGTCRWESNDLAAKVMGHRYICQRCADAEVAV